MRSRGRDVGAVTCLLTVAARRTQWLLNVADGPDKPFATHGSHEVHLVESWEPPAAAIAAATAAATTAAAAAAATAEERSERRTRPATKTVHAYSSAPRVELLVNGRSQGVRAIVPMVHGPGTYAEWREVPFEAGTLTAVATDASGGVVATTSRHTNGPRASLRLTVDAPHESTGTGSRLLLDGHDAALLRATLLDASGRRAVMAADTVSFRVVSGPGRVQGTHNGDPHARARNDAPSHAAYHGLVRAVVRVTSVAARPHAERAALARIDVGGPMAAGTNSAMRTGTGTRVQARVSTGGNTSAAAAADALELEELQPIVVEASAPGLPPARISIAVSTDAAADGIVAVAEAGAGKQVDFFATSAPQ